MTFVETVIAFMIAIIAVIVLYFMLAIGAFIIEQTILTAKQDIINLIDWFKYSKTDY